MSNSLVIYVRFHDGRYHGEDDWPPCPARLFQALVAGAGLGGPLGDDVRGALQWLETLSPPLIGAPYAWRGERVMFYMPNNDLDAVGGDPRRGAEIRTATKIFHPWHFDATIPFLYIWQDVPDAEMAHTRAIRVLADHLYQLGRSIDMAYAWGEELDRDPLNSRLANYPGRIFRPSAGTGGMTFLCPHQGSLDSVERRYMAYRQRFDVERRGNTVKYTFRKAPRPSFLPVAYDSPPLRFLYELRGAVSDVSFTAWPLAQACKLVVCLRDGAVERLKKAFPARHAEIERVLVGRKPDGTNEGSTVERVRIVPLPSIGHPQADRAIRRVLVEVPAGCPLRADDVHWAFSGLEVLDAETGEVYPIVLTPATDDGMLHHYGIGKGAPARIWRTVTPMALPEVAARRRATPMRTGIEGQGGTERAQEQHRAAAAAAQALRHAHVHVCVEAIRVHREPFDGNGECVEAFAPGTRFRHARLWHVEMMLAEPLAGPLVIGDGRFLGLGVMVPLSTAAGLHAFSVKSGLVGHPDPTEVARALRRAVMARVQAVLGNSKPLASFFSGHEQDGSPAQSEHHPHLAFVFEPRSERLLIIAPHVLDRREPNHEERQYLQALDEALTGFCELRAGTAGCLILGAIPIDLDTDPLFAPSRRWESVTPYVVSRHVKQVGSAEALSLDLRAECRRRGLPDPRVEPREPRGIGGIGLVGGAHLTFDVAVKGPLLLGKHRYLGGGLFVAKHDE